MIHYMNLVLSAFVKIADGSKTIELRLNDEKRQKIHIGDTVVFKCNENNNIITAKVKQLHKFSDFEELYNALPLEKCGYTVSELDTAHYTDMEHYYTEEQIKKYGVLGIELGNVLSVCESVAYHYDLLVAENNDPVHDPKPLRDYMDKWDGQAFIDKMELSKEKSVLEIGVGTGRLAVRVAPLCDAFYGIDLSPKTIERARENLSYFSNVTLLYGDFLDFPFNNKFDVIYSSLTFMHIEEKQKAINKVAALLKNGGKFALSIDKKQSEFLDYGTRKIRLYPDNADQTVQMLTDAGLTLSDRYETELAVIFISHK